jgi:hypothetical protein
LRPEREKRLRAIALSDTWAKRRFAVRFSDFEALQPPARRLLEYLVERADG